MPPSMLVGTLEFAKFLITIFIMCYVYYFLRRTEPDYERKPWEYMYVTLMFLFIVELISSLQLFKGPEYSYVFFDQLRNFAEFGFVAFLLFVVISQHYVLLKNGKILIKEKQVRTIVDRVKERFIRLEKEEDTVPPEEEFEEEISGMDSDKELEKQEKEIERVVGK